MILRVIFTLVVGVLISACVHDDDNVLVFATPPGIYDGTVTPTGLAADNAVALITSNNKIAIVDTDTLEAFIGTIFVNRITGTLFSSSVVPATGEVKNASGNNISGTYSSSIGGGTFDLVADVNLYNRGASLSKLVGTWVDSFFTSVTGTTTWVIQSDGSFTMSSTSGCSATGQFSLIDPSKNEYEINLTVSTCPSFNGTYSGIGALSDTFFTDDLLSFIFNNGSLGGLFQPVKQ